MTPRIDIEDMTDAQDEALNEANTMRDRLNTKHIWDMHRLFLLERTSDDPLYHASMWIMLLCDEIDKLRADLARPSQAGDESVAQAVRRVAQYLGRRKKTRSDDPDFIHGYDVSPEGGFILSASDLAVMVAALAAMDTPKGGGDEG